MLRWIGFDRAAILDGGLGDWKAQGFELSTDVVTPRRRELSCRVRPALVADRDEVRAAIDDSSVQLVDTLPPMMYQGQMAPYGRPGHIPSAVNICTMALLDPTGHYLPDAGLDAMHPFAKGTRVITYCGGGIMASASAFVMTRIGFEDVAVYIGSLRNGRPTPPIR